MRQFILGILVGSTLIVSASAAEKTYNLRPIKDILTEAVQCFKDGGRGALVGDLNEHGEVVSAWEAVCVLEVK